MFGSSSFGGLRVLHQLGSGVLGPVFRAHDPEHDRLVAIKTFTIDLIPEDAGRLAEALGHLVQQGPDHPALAGFVQAGLQRTTPYLATTFAPGETLDVWLRGRGALEPDTAFAILTPVAEALDAGWAAGIGHLALHPRDIFVTDDLDQVTLTGLGVAGALASVGVPRPARRPYTAPECADDAPCDARADVFSLAAIAHEMLTGRRPTSAGVAEAPFAADVPPGSAAALREALSHGMATDPAARPETASTLVASLRAALAPVQADLPLAGGIAAETDADTPEEHGFLPEASAAVAASDPADALRPSLDRRTFEDELPAAPPPPSGSGWWRLGAIAVVGLVIGLAGVAMFLSDQGDADTTEVIVERAAADPVQPVDAPTDTEVDLADDPPVVPDEAPAPRTAPPVIETPPPAPAARRVTAPTGQLLIRSEPSGAMVLVNGEMRGETPATVRDLPLGTHAIQVARPGYAPESRSVTLTPDVPSRNLTVPLQAGLDLATALPGSVYADSRPRGARVLIDGRLVGTTPLRLPDLSAGQRAVRIELDGYRTVTTTVTVANGREARIAVTLEPASGRAGGR